MVELQRLEGRDGRTQVMAPGGNSSVEMSVEIRYEGHVSMKRRSLGGLDQ